jgi:hypothetical protein
MRVAGRADLAIDLVAPLQLALVEGAERSFEREAAVAQFDGLALGEGRGRRQRSGRRLRRSTDEGLLHGADIRLDHGRDQPFFSA